MVRTEHLSISDDESWLSPWWDLETSKRQDSLWMCKINRWEMTHTQRGQDVPMGASCIYRLNESLSPACLPPSHCLLLLLCRSFLAWYNARWVFGGRLLPVCWGRVIQSYSNITIFVCSTYACVFMHVCVYLSVYMCVCAFVWVCKNLRRWEMDVSCLLQSLFNMYICTYMNIYSYIYCGV